jgi:hypothetical protein
VLGLLGAIACVSPEGPLYSSPNPTRPDPEFNRLFTRNNGGWTGGDGTLSIPLADGRTVWLFGDTFLGHVRPDNSRPADSPLIRNCLVVQNGKDLDTRFSGPGDDPQAFLVAEDPDAWYWPGDGTVQAEEIQIFFHRFRSVAPGIWGWAWDDTAIATVALPDLVLRKVVRRKEGNGVAYGASLLETEGWIHIFGTRPGGAAKQLHLARAPQGGLEGHWVYWAGSSWSPRAEDSRAILSGVSSQIGVAALNSGFGLVTMDARRPFTGRVVAYFAAQPTGPWRGPVPIYQAPEADDQVAAYNPFVHPQFSSANDFLISYNINHVHDPDMLYQDAGLYRPRFIRTDLNALAQRVAEPEDEEGLSHGTENRSGVSAIH